MSLIAIPVSSQSSGVRMLLQVEDRAIRHKLSSQQIATMHSCA